MTLYEIKKYQKLVSNCQREYIEACKAFLYDPDFKHWKGYTYAYIRLYGSLSNAHSFEHYIKIRASSLAFQSNVSTFHCDQMLENYQ